MFCRLGALGLLLALLGCTERVVLRDVWDAGPSLSSDASGAPSSDAFIADTFAGNMADVLATPADAPSVGDAHFGGRPEVERPESACTSGIRPLRPTPQTAQLFVLLDRSSGMQAPMGTAKRQDAVGNALVNAIGKYQNLVKFGFEQFPAGPLEGKGACDPKKCCAGSVMEPGLFALFSLRTFILCSERGSFSCPTTPGPDSPSHVALANVIDYFRNNRSGDNREPRYVLLVTTSEPSCAADLTANPCESAMASATTLGNSNVRIVVMSVGDQPSAGPCLTNLSQRRSRLDVPAGTKSLYTPVTADEVNQQMDELMLAIAKLSCVFDLESGPPDPAELVVWLGKERLSRDPTDAPKDGWRWFPDDNAKTGLALSGKACADYVAGASLSVGYRICP